MLIAVRDVREGDVLELPKGRTVRVERIDVYREPPVPGDGLDVEKMVVRWRAGDAYGSLAISLGDDMVQLLKRRDTPVGRW